MYTIQGDHSCQELKKVDGVEARHHFERWKWPFPATKGSLAMVCNITCNENVKQTKT